MTVLNFPLVTVVMPIRNEAMHIYKSLGAVMAQDYPTDRMEMIVADGMSTDGTREIVHSLQTHHANLRMIDNTKGIVPTGLNAALQVARGEIIVRVDGHCEIDQHYVRRCVEHLQTGGVDGVGGEIETIGETPLSRTIATAMSCWFGVGGSSFRTVNNKTMLTDTIPFPAYTRAIIQRAGAYDEELVRNQDDEYNYRLRKLGAKLLLGADVRSRYFSRSSISSLWRQYFRYGYWKVRVLQKHPWQMRPRQFVPTLFAVALLIAMLAMLFSTGSWMLALVAGSYLVANLSASTVTAWRQELWMAPFLPVVFGTMHLSYGLGFLLGLIRFSNRWGKQEEGATVLRTPAQNVANVGTYDFDY